jgi:hypothetical protein
VYWPEGPAIGKNRDESSSPVYYCDRMKAEFNSIIIAV